MPGPPEGKPGNGRYKRFTRTPPSGPPQVLEFRQVSEETRTHWTEDGEQTMDVVIFDRVLPDGTIVRGVRRAEQFDRMLTDLQRLARFATSEGDNP